ncbi:hypothetical protein LIER_07593 [Lithospermum erythrorhizon]|uniref:Uncharacterized protein n=1 Tax=Lithospermum erythrorhizon TaxID=34254 RepID=A0AAV3PAQ8_LITER
MEGTRSFKILFPALILRLLLLLAARLSRIFLFQFSSKRSFHLNTIQSNKEQLVKIRGKSGKRLKIYGVLDKENS